MHSFCAKMHKMSVWVQKHPDLLLGSFLQNLTNWTSYASVIA
jgi:hypothetical protein